MSIYSNLVGADDKSPLSRQLVLEQLQKNSAPVQNVPGQKTGWAPYVAQALNSVMLAGSVREIDKQNQAKLEKQKGLVAGLITKVKSSIANNDESGLVESMISFDNIGLPEEKVKYVVDFIGLALKNMQSRKTNQMKDTRSDIIRNNSNIQKLYLENIKNLTASGTVPPDQINSIAFKNAQDTMAYMNQQPNQSMPMGNTNQQSYSLGMGANEAMATSQPSNMAMRASQGRDVSKEAQKWIPYIGNEETDRLVARFETEDPQLFAEIQRQIQGSSTETPVSRFDIRRPLPGYSYNENVKVPQAQSQPIQAKQVVAQGQQPTQTVQQSTTPDTQEAKSIQLMRKLEEYSPEQQKIALSKLQDKGLAKRLTTMLKLDELPEKTWRDLTPEEGLEKWRNKSLLGKVAGEAVAETVEDYMAKQNQAQSDYKTLKDQVDKLYDKGDTKGIVTLLAKPENSKWARALNSYIKAMDRRRNG